jgi:hypothetical protein
MGEEKGSSHLFLKSGTDLTPISSHSLGVGVVIYLFLSRRHIYKHKVPFEYTRNFPSALRKVVI